MKSLFCKVLAWLRPRYEYRLSTVKYGDECIAPPPGGWVLHSVTNKWNSLDLHAVWVRKGGSRS